MATDRIFILNQVSCWYVGVLVVKSAFLENEKNFLRTQTSTHVYTYMAIIRIFILNRYILYLFFVLSPGIQKIYFRCMETISISEAVRLAREVSQLPEPQNRFTIAFFPYSRSKGEASAKLVTKENCTFRSQLPKDKFAIDSDNFFLYADEKGNPKACYRILVRYIGFAVDNFKLRKVKSV